MATGNVSHPSFIKRNAVLIVGLVLPVLLVLGFLVSSILVIAKTAPPQYQMLFVSAKADQLSKDPYEVNFLVKNGKVVVQFDMDIDDYRAKNGYPKMTRYKKRLMVYDGKTQQVSEILYDLSKVKHPTNKQEVMLEELARLKVDSSMTSPDGYTYQDSVHSQKLSLLAKFLDSNIGFVDSPRLVKGASKFELPDYKNHTQFLGWILTNDQQGATGDR